MPRSVPTVAFSRSRAETATCTSSTRTTASGSDTVRSRRGGPSVSFSPDGRPSRRAPTARRESGIPAFRTAAHRRDDEQGRGPARRRQPARARRGDCGADGTVRIVDVVRRATSRSCTTTRPVRRDVQSRRVARPHGERRRNRADLATRRDARADAPHGGHVLRGASTARRSAHRHRGRRWTARIWRSRDGAPLDLRGPRGTRGRRRDQPRWNPRRDGRCGQHGRLWSMSGRQLRRAPQSRPGRPRPVQPATETSSRLRAPTRWPASGGSRTEASPHAQGHGVRRRSRLRPDGTCSPPRRTTVTPGSGTSAAALH